MKQNILHADLTALLDYDPSTGVFTQKIHWWNRKPGDRLGCVSPQGYWYIGVGGKQYPAHRLAWFYVHKEWPDNDIDHINRDRLDNRIENLRCIPRSANLHNSPARGASKVKGVSWDARNKVWYARIMVNYVSKHLGAFKVKEDAIAARKAAEELQHTCLQQKFLV